MKRLLIVLFAVMALVATACGASGSDAGGSDETPTTAADTEGTATETENASFGTIEEPLCGPGDFTVDPAEAGKGADKLYIGVPNDRSSEIRPGLNKVMYDASVAYAGWCNEQGGIGGLPIEIIDMDAALFNVEAVMTKACTEAFAMVGGGLAQDSLEFSGKDGSDFHKCGLVDLPGYAVSVEKAGSNGQVQAVPNPPDSIANTWFQDMQKLQPESVESFGVLWGELPNLEIVKDKQEAAATDAGVPEIIEAQTYPVTGASDWTPYSQKLIGSGATSFGWVGEVVNLSNFLMSVRQQGWEGTPILEANMYDPALLAAGAAAEGAVIRMGFHPMEEKDEWPAIQQYEDMVTQYVPDGELGQLGEQSLSSWLLFTVAANACGEANDGVLTRTCILEQAAEVSDWTGGGMHAPQDPARFDEAEASPCGMLVVVKDGKFERLYPEIGGEGDDIDGFHCPEDGVTEVNSDVAKSNIDPNRTI